STPIRRLSRPGRDGNGLSVSVEVGKGKRSIPVRRTQSPFIAGPRRPPAGETIQTLFEGYLRTITQLLAGAGDIQSLALGHQSHGILREGGLRLGSRQSVEQFHSQRQHAGYGERDRVKPRAKTQLRQQTIQERRR